LSNIFGQGQYLHHFFNFLNGPNKLECSITLS